MRICPGQVPGAMWSMSNCERRRLTMPWIGSQARSHTSPTAQLEARSAVPPGLAKTARARLSWPGIRAPVRLTMPRASRRWARRSVPTARVSPCRAMPPGLSRRALSRLIWPPTTAPLRRSWPWTVRSLAMMSVPISTWLSWSGGSSASSPVAGPITAPCRKRPPDILAPCSRTGPLIRQQESRRTTSTRTVAAVRPGSVE